MKDNTPAFPVTEDNYVHKDNTGMTLRDYFAAKWLQGFMANPSVDEMTTDLAACKAYQVADAMMKARTE
jgi:hypothetical protein